MDNDHLLRLIFKWRVDAAHLQRADDEVVRSMGDARYNDALELEGLLIDKAMEIQ